MNTKHINLLNKLLYRSMYRGCRESEIIFANFANNFLDKLNIAQLSEYEEILSVPDATLLDWIMFNKPIQDEYQNNSVLKMIILFAKNETQAQHLSSLLET